MLKDIYYPKFFLVVFNALIFVAHSQGQSGFISLDCGLPENLTYTEETTEIAYISDSAFINNGESKNILPENLNRTLNPKTTLRSFPEGIRNCYEINTRKGTKYLIRATFLYGNYDSKNKAPEFDLHLGVNFWDTVRFEDVSVQVIKEVIHFPARNRVMVCLANTGYGTPFINVLELRPLLNTTYVAQNEASLGLVARMDVGSTTNNSYRYPNDAFDRLWIPYADKDWKVISTPEIVDPQFHIDFQPPSVIMSNAVAPANASVPWLLNFEPKDINTGYYLYMHFAEIQQLKANETRSFDIKVNGRRLFGPVSLNYLTSRTAYTVTPVSGELNYAFTLEMVSGSKLPPTVNAIEIYVLMDLSGSETDKNDVDVMTEIKSRYGVQRNWDGDPCLPVKFLWSGLNCTIDGSNPPRIISLNLSSSGLTGEIPTLVADLNMLELLDLSSNDLIGPVPNFLAQLPNLRVLNLANNKLTGVVPDQLIARLNHGSLSLNVHGNRNLCASFSCEKNDKRKVVVPIVASVSGSFFVLIIAATVFVVLKNKRKQGKAKSNNQRDSFRSRRQKFTYSEIVTITKNFDKVLGKGGFATVYYGILGDGTEVAVKKINLLPPVERSRLSQSQGIDERNRKELEEQNQQFKAEVKLLLTVYHGNLTSLVGHCKQGTNMILIYEYMANGDLESHLSGKQGKVLSWETRLQIAIDSAQGLEYLHRGCKPPIIHRDIKAANILITKNFRAKLADFGLSKFFLTDDGTHVSTMHIAGTPGYLDPEMANGGLLNEKTDVYSFGVVLLQIITSRPARSKVNNQDGCMHLSNWVQLMLNNGNVKGVIDEKLRGEFEINSLWKAIEVAMNCVSMPATNRPNMSDVVSELRECFALERARKRVRVSNHSTNVSLNVTRELRPVTR